MRHRRAALDRCLLFGLVVIEGPAKQPAHAQLVSRDFGAIAVYRAAAIAQLVVEFRAVGGRTRLLVRKSDVPGIDVFQCLVISPVGAVYGRSHLSKGIQYTMRQYGKNPPGANGAGRPDALDSNAIFPFADAAVDGQGSAALSPRSHAVVSIFDFFRAFGLVFFQRPPLQLRLVLHRLGKHGQFFESFGSGLIDVHVHDPIYLPHAQPGRTTILAIGPFARPPRDDSLEQVSICSRHGDSSLFDFDFAQRLNAGYFPAGNTQPSTDVFDFVFRVGGDRRGNGGPAAQYS